MMMNKALLSARSGEAGRTFIFCHPMVKLYLDQIGKTEFMNTSYGDSRADFQLETWNGVPIVTSYNFVEGAETNIITMTGCYFTGSVTATGANHVGGLVGIAGWSKISSCYVTGSVQGGGNAGGLVGRYQNSATVNSYATGAVSGANDVGGLFGAVWTGSSTATNCVALNPSVRGGTVGRIIGNPASITLSDNAAFSGMTNNAGTTVWGECLPNNKNGADKTAAEIAAAGFFQGIFTGNTDIWTFAAGKLPGFNGETVNMPNYLIEELFTLSESDSYTFPWARPGYDAVTSLNVTVTNIVNRAIGPLTIELDGANAASFDLSATGIASIAAGNTASFTVSPKTGLSLGNYTATVTVSGGNDSYPVSESFNVTFLVGVKDVIDIIIEQQPKLNYVAGEPLDLTGLNHIDSYEYKILSTSSLQRVIIY